MTICVETAALGCPSSAARQKFSEGFRTRTSHHLLFLSAMPRTLDPDLRRALAARIRYYNEMGIYDFYRRPVSIYTEEIAAPIAMDEQDIVSINPESGEEMSPRKAAAVAMPVAIEGEENIFEVIALKPEQSVSDPVKALKIIREDLGDCTRCVLHKQGRTPMKTKRASPSWDAPGNCSTT